MATQTHILGDGVAAMMLASKADTLHNHQLTIIHPEGAPQVKDHMLGFWQTPELDFAVESSRASWSKWSVITDEGEFELESKNHPYHAMHKVEFLQNCREKAESKGVKFSEQNNAEGAELVFDSRPPIAPKNAMLQHFLGQEISVDKPIFDSSKAILMDFRVDQSKGMHFICLLPFSPTCALIESTLFSTVITPREYYVDTINSYLSDNYGLSSFEVIHEEKGVIPMGNLAPHDSAIPGIGANAGAIRPASGYTFAFIQQQIQSAINETNKGKPLKFKRPHKSVDVWMDGVLLTVLRHWPNQGPKLFGRMAASLTGDQFIRFMSGQAGWGLRMKVILAMPKLPFIKGASKFIFTRPEKVVS